jgi:hypothetical protein
MVRPGRPERNRAARSFRQLRRSITSSTQIRFSVHTGHFQPSRCDCRPLIAVWLYHGCLRDADQRGTWGDAIGDGARVLRRAGYAVDAEPDRGGLNLYSITSSAPLTSEGENSSPRLFAAFRLMMSSTFVTSWTGRSEGFSPLRIRPA